MPPHPAALLALTAYKADIGRTIVYAIIVGLPTAALAGPVFAKFIAPRIKLPDVNPLAAQFIDSSAGRELPGFGVTLATVMLPVVLMLVGSWADAILPKGSTGNAFLQFIGNTDISLLIATILSFITLGTARGFSRETILRFTTECLAPTAVILMLIGAGAGFGRILIDSGVSKAIVGVALDAHISLLVLAWLLAAIVRLAAGSSTVAMSTAAAIVAPIAAASPGTSAEMLVLVTGAGSLLFSHVNDGGFWLVKEYFNMTVVETLKTWSVLETIISVVALLLTLALSMVV
jgi:GntP family gluconate:H+ symporter